MGNRELTEYVLEQLGTLEQVRSIPMMGGTIFYYRERIFGGIYAGDFLVKDVPAARKAMPDSVSRPPYQGAKNMLPVIILEDARALCAMVEEMFPELPQRKTRKPKRRKE